MRESLCGKRAVGAPKPVTQSSRPDLRVFSFQVGKETPRLESDKHGQHGLQGAPKADQITGMPDQSRRAANETDSCLPATRQAAEA